MGDLSPHFSRSEFRCRCGCGADAVLPALVERLEQIRAILGRPIVIRSGCRCPAHNRAVGGMSGSAHVADPAGRLCCGAADIAVDGDGARWDLVLAAIRVGICRIGVAQSFVHVDVDAGHPQDRIWVYPARP